MNSLYSPKLQELKKIINDIDSHQKTLSQIDCIKSPQQVSQEAYIELLKEKTVIKKTLNGLTARKEQLNEELADNEELSEAIKMKYALLLIKNYASATECSF